MSEVRMIRILEEIVLTYMALSLSVGLANYIRVTLKRRRAPTRFL